MPDSVFARAPNYARAHQSEWDDYGSQDGDGRD
jgi:hypothetical protein